MSRPWQQRTKAKQALPKSIERLVITTDPALVAGLAKSYFSKELGELEVLRTRGGVTQPSISASGRARWHHE